MRECGLKLNTEYKLTGPGESLLMRECGLKLGDKAAYITTKPVTPYAGVWIETFEQAEKIAKDKSLLMRECGLKQRYVFAPFDY